MQGILYSLSTNWHASLSCCDVCSIYKIECQWIVLRDSIKRLRFREWKVRNGHRESPKSLQGTVWGLPIRQRRQFRFHGIVTSEERPNPQEHIPQMSEGRLLECQAFREMVCRQKGVACFLWIVPRWDLWLLSQFLGSANSWRGLSQLMKGARVCQDKERRWERCRGRGRHSEWAS